MRKKNTETSKADIFDRQPAKSLEEQEQRMIALSLDLAERQLREGTASSQVITHYLKLGSMKERAEKEKLQEEIKLLRAKTSNIESAKKVEELYSNALNAMREYSGRKIDEDE